jgi:metal transporter CNNM
MFIPKIPTKDSLDSLEFWWKMTTSAFLVLAGGVFAGLTIGLMGLDELHLRVLATSSEEEAERTDAQIVLNLMQRGRHWVLVVLLLSNVIINESLPIFLDSAIGGGLLAIVISATAIVIFGEVIPQAVCARHGLVIGARCAPFVLLLMYLFAPVAYPIAKILDRVLGVHDAHTYRKAELKSFLQFHRTGEEPLHDDEIAILNGVLELSSKNVETIMTPIRDVVMLSSDTILDHSTMNAILTSGYSRFPVHKPGNSLAFEGLLLIKKLLMYDPTRGLPVSHFPLSILPEALPSINCFQALDYFQTGRAHLLLISRTPGSPGGGIGVITLEDVIEEMISEEIVDETDQYEDNQSKRHAKRMINTTAMRDIVELERSIFPQTSTQVTSMNIEVVPLLPGSSQQDYPQAYRYVYNSMGESEH